MDAREGVSTPAPVLPDTEHRWVGRMPAAWRPYLQLARLDRPAGIWLILLPCWWGVALAVPPSGRAFPDLVLMTLFALGALVMRGAGCTYNDIVDRDIDARVERTRGRPLPSGALSVRAAWIFAIALSLIGLVVLLCFNNLTIILGIASLTIVAAYPFAKRVTFWPQLVLGLAFNWGALMGYAAATNTLAWPTAFLYIAGIFWTLGYDTVYAHQDKEDDALIGVKSSALALGRRTRSFLAVVYGLALVFVTLAGWTAGMGAGLWLGLCAVALHFGWQVWQLDIDDPANCLKLFRANRGAGFLIFLALLLGGLTA